MSAGRCPVCGAAFTATAVGDVCGACLLRKCVERRFIGDFELLQGLGEGGTGVVHLAEHAVSGELVALKIAKKELLDRPGLLVLFRQQAKVESSLQHPNIVQVRGVGTHEGLPYLVMPFLEGGTLADDDNVQYWADAPARLQLMLTIARAVQHAHERGVLHCDLKHENILFDGSNQPRVSDFGIARAIGSAKASDAAEFEGGTRGWMSPEQVRREELTTASDVFALGVLLYWLGTQRLPFGSDDDFERRILEDSPPELPRWSPDLDWALLAVAHRALQKKPTERYPTAAAFVEDLQRLAEKKPIRGATLPTWARVWYWTERHPGARNALFLLLPCFALVALLLSQAQRDDLRRAALDVNAYAASGQAAAVLYQLREYADAVERAANDPAVVSLTHGPRKKAPSGPPPANPCAIQTELEDATPLVRHARAFSTFIVVDSSGCSRARVAEGQPSLEYVQRHVDWRRYLIEAQLDPTVRERTRVRKAYRSTVSQLIKFAVATPLFEDGRWTGIVAGSIAAASTLELPRMNRAATTDRLTVLLGPFDAEEPGTRREAFPEFTFLVHPRLGRGDKVVLDARSASELARTFGDSPASRQFELATALPLQRASYVDPLLGDQWLAAFAPVGATGYVVLVQTRENVILRPTQALRRFALGLLVASLSLLATWGAFFAWRYRSQRRRARADPDKTQ